MPRKVKDTDLSNRTTRGRLKAQPKPYWRLISEGRHIGYRRRENTAGSWIARVYLGPAEGYREEVFGIADDLLSADGVKILDFSQAQDGARAWFAQQVRRSQGIEEGPTEPYTVAAVWLAIWTGSGLTGRRMRPLGWRSRPTSFPPSEGRTYRLSQRQSSRDGFRNSRIPLPGSVRPRELPSSFGRSMDRKASGSGRQRPTGSSPS